MTEEFIQAACAYCATMDEYDRSSTPHLLRKMTIARRTMRMLYTKETRDERAPQPNERYGS